MAQPIFQEPPPSPVYSGHSSYWSNPGVYESAGAGAKVCKETTNDLVNAQDHLYRVKDDLLNQIGGDCRKLHSNCTKIIISSVGEALLRHPPR